MPKYYVISGELKEIVDAKSPKDAAYQSLLKASGQTVGKFFQVDERGFRETPQWTIPYGEIIGVNDEN